MNVKLLLKNASGVMAAVLLMACSGAGIEGSWVNGSGNGAYASGDQDRIRR